MIVSEARREANRRNAAKSTGPKTEAGKNRSRMNALDHGLAAEVVRHPEDEPTGAAPAPGGTAFDAWLAGEIALTTRRLDRCRRSEAMLREEAVLRARNHWDDDRRTEAEALGATLAGDPAGVVDRLRRTPRGCDWLIRRWLLLVGAAGSSIRWAEEHTAMAFDLLGTPEALRGLQPGGSVDPTTLLATRADHPTALARREIEALREQRLRVVEADAFARGLALADLRDEPTAELRRLRRYEASLHRRLKWCLEQLPPGAANHLDLPEPEPEPALPVEVVPPEQARPEPAPKPAYRPTFVRDRPTSPPVGPPPTAPDTEQPGSPAAPRPNEPIGTSLSGRKPG